MDNDKQITGTSVEQIKSVFLSEDLLAKYPRPEIYSLPDEFAASKKNRNPVIFFLILLYIATIGTGVFLITSIQENKSKRIEVNIAEFRQFNLMELLAEKKENEERVVQLQRELEELRINSLKEIKRLSLSPKEQEKAIAALNEKMKALEESYNQEIKDKEAAIKKLEKTIESEQKKLALNRQESERIIKNSQLYSRMQAQEMERMEAQYEGKIARLIADHKEEIERLNKDHQNRIEELILRYNPKFSRGKISEILNSKLGNTADKTWNKYSRLLPENKWNRQNYNQLREKIEAQRLIISTLQKIPYTNSVPTALDRLDRLSRSIIGDYEYLWFNLAERIKEKNTNTGSYEYALNYLSMLRRDSGYVIDPRDPNRMVVFIHHIYSVKKGDFAYIYKNDNVAIAKIELNPEANRITAKVVEVLQPAKIEPFDKILLKLEVAKK